jgi:hypothetical protein
MLSGPVIKIILLICIPCLMLGGAFGYGYYRGHKAGTESVQAEWDADKLAARDAHDELVQQLAKQEAAHAQRQEQVAYELAQARESHDADLNALRRVYEQRLLQSTRRSQVYRDQAQAGSDSCSNLASHASELDRALEEGRGLVGELRETLGLRESQIVLLADQIRNDRKLLEVGGSK